MAEIKGIDVSANQGNINWKTVANYGMGFAILRITEKGNIVDSTFEKNYKGCTDNKIPVGVYKYSYATSIDQIKTEANVVVKTLNKRKLNYPVFLDLENKCQQNISKNVMMQMINAFRTIILNAGYKFGIYCNESWYNNYLPDDAKKYDCWIAHYPDPDNGTMQTRVKPKAGIAWQYSQCATIPGVSTKVDRSVFYKDYSKSSSNSTNTSNNNSNNSQGSDNVANNIVQNIINDAVSFAVAIANDNSHGYSQAVRSLYNITNPKSFDCSSLACTAYYYAFLKNGLTEQANYLKAHCSYTGNMLNMTNVGFEIVARNQTAHTQMKKGDLELNVNYHVAIAIDKDNIVHARSSEGTTNTIDDSGNEIRTQPWYNYSHGWTHRLRFTGKGLNLSSSTNTSTTTTTKNWIEYGDKGEDVKTLQTKLNKVGYNLEVDGVSGDATVAAIKDFQKKYNLTVDGQAGKNTITKLDSVIAAKENSTFKAFVGACTTDSTPVYQKVNSTTALATYPKLNRGNLVDVIGVSGSRYKIKIANAYTGYIEKSKITTPDKLTTTTYPHGVCTGNDVAVRKDAGTSYAKISGYPTLNKNDEVDILGSKKDNSGNVWKKVRIAGKYTGYVFGKYIKQD